MLSQTFDGCESVQQLQIHNWPIKPDDKKVQKMFNCIKQKMIDKIEKQYEQQKQ